MKKNKKKYQAGGSTADRAWIDVQKRTLDGKPHQAKSGAKVPPKPGRRGT